MNKIEIKNIEIILLAFLKRLKDEGIDEICYEENFYWNVPTDKMVLFPNEPELTVGSINDDYKFINTLIDENYITDYLELERLSSLLKFMAIHLRKL